MRLSKQNYCKRKEVKVLICRRSHRLIFTLIILLTKRLHFKTAIRVANLRSKNLKLKNSVFRHLPLALFLICKFVPVNLQLIFRALKICLAANSCKLKSKLQAHHKLPQQGKNQGVVHKNRKTQQYLELPQVSLKQTMPIRKTIMFKFKYNHCQL